MVHGVPTVQTGHLHNVTAPRPRRRCEDHVRSQRRSSVSRRLPQVLSPCYAGHQAAGPRGASFTAWWEAAVHTQKGMSHSGH